MLFDFSLIEISNNRIQMIMFQISPKINCPKGKPCVVSAIGRHRFRKTLHLAQSSGSQEYSRIKILQSRVVQCLLKGQCPQSCRTHYHRSRMHYPMLINLQRRIISVLYDRKWLSILLRVWRYIIRLMKANSIFWILLQKIILSL